MFPYDNHVGVAMGRRMVAPVLESYAAGTDSLEKYYVQALERRKPGSLEVVYGLDGAQMGGIQAIARTPRIFEYIYHHFESTNGESYPDGRYKLHARHASEATVAAFSLTPTHQTADRGELTLATPSTCGLLQLQVRLDYARNTVLFRPSGFEMRISDGDQQVWQGSVGPIESNREFMTYISTLPPEAFHQVFSQGPIRSRKWNKIEYWPAAADPLGAAAEKVRIEEIQCLDPQKYVDAAPGTPAVIAQ
jgi:hypothetical protein